MDPLTQSDALCDEALGARTDRRIALLTEALQLCPSNVRGWVALGDTYARPYLPDQTADAGAAEEPPPTAEALAKFREEALSRIEERLRRAREEWQQPATPEERRRRFEEARRKLEANRPKPLDPQRAREAYLKAAEVAADSALPYLRLANLDHSDPAATAAHLERAMAAEPANALAFCWRALLHFEAGEDDRGRECLAAARVCKGIRYPILLPGGPQGLLQATSVMATETTGLFPYLVRFRELARHIARVSEGLASSSNPAVRAARARLQGDGKLMARRVLLAHPRSLLSAMVGVALHKIVSKGGAESAVDQGDAQRIDTVREMVSGTVRALPGVALRGLLSGGLFARAEPWADEARTVDMLLAESGLDPDADE